ncbi:MAG: hypothetical protein K1X55_02890, partial [Chitinophagales bacterium]|nr:hypothetical protein [Chitinophagales bacterium]
TASSSNNTRYPIGYGSSWIFKKLWADSAKVLYEQVCEGGHDILQYSMRGSWNYEGQPFDINDPRNNYNPVFLRIEDFVLKTLGKRSPGFIKGLTGFVPDSTNAKCTNESDPLKTDTTWAITADSLTYGWEGTCANRYIYAQKKGRETIVYRWRFYQGNTPVTGWLSTIEPKLNVNFVPVNSTYTVKLQTQNGCGLGGIQSKTISFTPFSCRMAGAVDEEIPNSITNALSEPDNIDGEWLRIVDMGGRVILEGKFPLESDWQQVFIYELDVPSGIYIVQQLRENKIMNTKIFKP